MSSQPYLRAADDGTYELLVPSRGSVHILPYCFYTDEARRTGSPAAKAESKSNKSTRNMKKRERVSSRYAYAPQTQPASIRRNSSARASVHRYVNRLFLVKRICIKPRRATHPGCQERTHADPRRAG